MYCSKIRINRGVLCLMAIALAGCAVPPDVIESPTPQSALEIARDKTLSGSAAIPSTILDRALATPLAHELILLEDGDDALLARIHLIRAATQSIDIQTFIWVYDRSGSWVFKELLDAARRGVRVRLLIDQFVPPKITAAEYAAMATAHSNLEIRLFRPVSTDAINSTWTVTQNTLTRTSTLNRRMHNKVMLVDRAVAITGGRNYQDAYYDRDPVMNFLDRDVLFSGPAIRDALESFEQFWDARKCYEASRMDDLREELESGRARLPDSLKEPVHPVFAKIDTLANRYDIAAERPTLRTWQVGGIEFLWDSPAKLNPLGLGSDRDAFEPLLESMLAGNEEIIVQTPYAIVGEKYYKLIRKIRKENPGIRFRILTNSVSASDHIYAAGIALKQRRIQIEELQFEMHASKPVPGDIRELVGRYDQLLQETANASDSYTETDPDLLDLDIKGPRFCVHSKSMVIDRQTSYIGSHNFDPRSFNLNTECGILIEDEAFSVHLRTIIERGMNPRNSWVVAARDYPPIMAELNSLITFITSNLPMFDVWPLEHATCYELIEGREPVPASHGDFYKNHRDVGPLPGLDIGIKSVQAQLVRGFAGFASPLM